MKSIINGWIVRRSVVPVLELDLSVDYDKNQEYKLELIKQIKKFIESKSNKYLKMLM